MSTKNRTIQLLIVLFSIVLLIQCGGKSTNPDPTRSIKAIWIWKVSVGGIAGEIRTPETEGYGHILSFNSDSTFSREMINTTGFDIYEGSYYIKYEEITFFSHIDSGYVLYMDNAEPALVTLDGLSLSLADMCADCFTSGYTRLTE